MKAVFMGTPDFAVPTLQKMVDMGIGIRQKAAAGKSFIHRSRNVLWPMIFRFISRSASRRILNLFRHCVIWHRM